MAIYDVVDFLEAHFFFEAFDLYGGPALVILLIFLFLAETVRRLRKRKANKWKRSRLNFAVAIPAGLTLRLVLLPALVFLAREADKAGIGLFNWLELPVWLVWLLAFVLLDYGNYLWHVLNHKSDFLWRFHNVHHIDLDLDVTTAIRFHFGEIFISAFFRGLLIILIGPPVLLVLVYEIFFEGATFFHHSNWKLPFKLERGLSKVIVTPRMHGIHHSVVKKETDSNFSIILNCWDRLHRSIRLNIPQQEINIGVPSYRDPEEQNFKNLLLMPLKKPRPWEFPDGQIPDRSTGQGKGDLEP